MLPIKLFNIAGAVDNARERFKTPLVFILSGNMTAINLNNQFLSRDRYVICNRRFVVLLGGSDMEVVVK